jgi:hypothetical protein
VPASQEGEGRRARSLAEILTATLTTKPMDARGHGGQNGTRNPRLFEATTRHGTRWTNYLPIRNQQVAGSNPADGSFLFSQLQFTLIARFGSG